LDSLAIDMATNPYRAKPSGPYQEAATYESLVVQAIKWSGHDIYYIPRSVNRFDKIYGEDVLASFEIAVPVEVYLENVTGFSGEGSMISKFGFELRESATFVIARRRYMESIKEYVPDSRSEQLSLRPNEGDLIYYPQTKSFFEIKYVEGSEPFNQLQAKFIWKLNCELFQFNSEKFDTGIEEIDAIRETSANRLAFSILDESGNLLITESGGNIILEEFNPQENSGYGDNNYLKNEFLEIMDFNEDNPFSERF